MTTTEFGCTRCGHPAVTLPATLDDDALVLCGGCRAVIARWGAFKRHAHSTTPPGARRPPLVQRIVRFDDLGETVLERS